MLPSAQKLQHFKGLSGVRAELTVGIEITVTSPAGWEIVMNVMGTFQQEVRIAVNVSGGADWKWKWKNISLYQRLSRRCFRRPVRLYRH